MYRQLTPTPALIGPYSRRRRTKLFSPVAQFAVLAVASLTVGAVLAFVL